MFSWFAFAQSVCREATARIAPRAVVSAITLLGVTLSLDTVIAVWLAGNRHCVNMVGVARLYTVASFCDSTYCLVEHYSIKIL